MINTEKTFKGIQPFRLGGEPSGYHTGGMINTDKPLKGIQPFRLGGGGKHQGIIQAEWSTLRNPSRGFNPLGWVGGGPSGYHRGGMINTEKPFKGIQPFGLDGDGNHQGTIQSEWSTLINPSRGFNPLGWVGGKHRGTVSSILPSVYREQADPRQDTIA